MTTSKDLMLAILAMDSYNEGYGQGLITGTTKIGDATLLGPADGVPVGQLNAWKSAGFYAAAYDTPYGKVISYRGTVFDSTPLFHYDVANGWPVALGINAAPQAQLATAFYKAVTELR